MSDIDFDELDRAVNDVLGGTPVQNTQASPAPAPAAEAPAVFERVERTTLSSVEPTPAASLLPTPAPTPTPAPAQTAPAARRSSGRFMDMVHPSSDMRSSAPVTPPVGRSSFAAAPIAPAPQPVVEAPAPVETPAWNEPLESPFLPDTKVEKRPLGGVTITPDVTITDAFDFQGLLDEPDEELLEAPQPQERIEATTTPDSIDFAAATGVPEEIETPPVQQEEAVVAPDAVVVEETQTPVVEVEPTPVAEFAPVPPRPIEEPVGPTSITPQYKEQASTASQESGAIYDTESYHQPVVQPVKKKSGWLTVIWILLLVLIGAGAGWAVYTFVLPML